jgi:hypothetical protein
VRSGSGRHRAQHQGATSAPDGCGPGVALAPRSSAGTVSPAGGRGRDRGGGAFPGLSGAVEDEDGQECGHDLAASVAGSVARPEGSLAGGLETVCERIRPSQVGTP